MMKILITGANSYIGMSFERYLSQWQDRYTVDTVDMQDATWRERSFSGYDAVFHVAGLAHSDRGKISEADRRRYYEVNTRLAIETAEKARADGVGQFIFMSSAIVYGDSAPVGREKCITADTPVSPANCYGDSKLQAEIGIRALEADSFRVVILRPPMIYGPGCRGNYPVLSRLARKLPLFPYVENQRSMLYIENLCTFVRLMIDNGERGTFWPQNAEYSNTCDMVAMIAAEHGKRIHFVRGVTWLLRLMGHCSGMVNRAFGNLSYSRELSRYKEAYQTVSLQESIRRTEV